MNILRHPKWTVTTDMVTTTIVAENADQAARNFAKSEKIRNVRTAADLARIAAAAGGWARVNPQ